MRNDRNGPRRALQRLHHLRARRRVADQDHRIGARLAQPLQLWRHVDVLVVKFLRARELDSGCLRGRREAREIRLAPAVVDRIRPGDFELKVVMACLINARSTSASTADTRNT